MGRLRIAIVPVALVVALAPAAGALGKRHRGSSLPGIPVPPGFVGVNASGPVLSPNVDLAAQLDQMVSSGVGTIRVVFDWSQAQPFAGMGDVPPSQRSDFTDVGGIPTDFHLSDEIVGLAAQRGLSVLPTVIYAPAWDRGTNPSGGAAPPARSGPYASYLAALIERYGPHGTF